MRIKVKIHSFSTLTCTKHWLVRRFSPDGGLLFGFGMADENNAILEFPGEFQTGFFSNTMDDWQEIYLSCQSQLLLQTICIVFEASSMATPAVLLVDNLSYIESTNDILFLGPGLSPWDNQADLTACGDFSILSLTISLGANAFPLDNCFGG